MAKLEDYKDLEVFKECRKLVKTIYDQTTSFPKEEIYGLTNQIRRSAVSILSNLAEGLGRQHTTDTIHFMFIARGSLCELEAQLMISLDLSYITQVAFDALSTCITICFKLLNGFINYLKTKKK